MRIEQQKTIRLVLFLYPSKVIDCSVDNTRIQQESWQCITEWCFALQWVKQFF